MSTPADLTAPLSRFTALSLFCALPSLLLLALFVAGGLDGNGWASLLAVVTPMPLAAVGLIWLQVRLRSDSRRVRLARHRVEARLMPLAALMGLVGGGLSALALARFARLAQTDWDMAAWALGTAAWWVGGAFALMRCVVVMLHTLKRRQRGAPREGAQG